MSITPSDVEQKLTPQTHAMSKIIIAYGGQILLDFFEDFHRNGTSSQLEAAFRIKSTRKLCEKSLIRQRLHGITAVSGCLEVQGVTSHIWNIDAFFDLTDD